MNEHATYVINLMHVNNLTQVESTSYSFSDDDSGIIVSGKLCGISIVYEFTYCNAEQNEPACIEINFRTNDINNDVMYESPRKYVPITLSVSTKNYIINKLQKYIPNIEM